MLLLPLPLAARLSVTCQHCTWQVLLEPSRRSHVPVARTMPTGSGSPGTESVSLMPWPHDVDASAVLQLACTIRAALTEPANRSGACCAHAHTQDTSEVPALLCT